MSRLIVISNRVNPPRDQGDGAVGGLAMALAAALREHLDPRATTPAARLIQARAFERAVEANRGRLHAELNGLLDKKK